MSTPADLDQLWQLLVGLVMDTRGDWRKKIVAASGLPFSQTRALRRLGGGPLTMSELRAAMDCDAPAATVIVNGLEEQGLVERTPHPEDRRAKMVALTATGRARLAKARAVPDLAPEVISSLQAEDVTTLLRILGPLLKP